MGAPVAGGEGGTRRKPQQAGPARVHFLDVGEQEYGDAVLCELGAKRILIDGAHPGDQTGSGGHPSIPQQLTALLDEPVPVRIDLLVVSHAHQDHIGCLPFLVEHRVIEVEWALVADPKLGWGRTEHDSVARPAEPRVSALRAALREELLDPDTDERTLARFLADAAGLEQRYGAMLAQLEERGTQVVRHGRDDPAELLAAFEEVGLELLGPSQEQLLVCAEAVARREHDAALGVDALVAEVDPLVSDSELYRQLVVSDATAIDAMSRPGPAINLQSVVTAFECEGVKLLFAGDMQFADAQLASPVVARELELLRERIRERAPFDLVKVSHHGSANAFDAAVLNELGATPLFGICAGEESSSHPSVPVLRLLEAERDRLDWVRTDRNGLVTVELDGETRLSLTRGEVDDPRPNAPDTAERPASPGRRVAVREETRGRGEHRASEVRTAAREGDRDIEVVTRIPPGVEHVTVSIEVADHAPVPTQPTPSDREAALTLAGGRRLPPLLFATSQEALATNVGTLEAEAALAAIEQSGALLFPSLPSGQTDPARCLALVREQLQDHRDLRGVVLVGGCDVVPAQRLDCLPADLRARLGHTNDPDDFLVWSDDGYGDTDGDLIAELPVSRIPDGKSGELLIAALCAGDQERQTARVGVRNVARPFAEPVFDALPGDDPLLVSEPTTFDTAPALGGQHVYLMLHGDYIDSSNFTGEGTADGKPAVNLSNVPDPGGRVVLAGCCWGALTASQPARFTPAGQSSPAKAAGTSMALAFLQGGATAFVGCTGAHYSPLDEPYGYYGGPMHAAFWAALLAGTPPAEALFEAKVEYVRGFPHGRQTAVQQAVEYKTLRQFTCLGLGW